MKKSKKLGMFRIFSLAVMALTLSCEKSIAVESNEGKGAVVSVVRFFKDSGTDSNLENSYYYLTCKGEDKLIQPLDKKTIWFAKHFKDSVLKKYNFSDAIDTVDGGEEIFFQVYLGKFAVALYRASREPDPKEHKRFMDQEISEIDYDAGTSQISRDSMEALKTYFGYETRSWSSDPVKIHYSGKGLSSKNIAYALSYTLDRRLDLTRIFKGNDRSVYICTKDLARMRGGEFQPTNFSVPMVITLQPKSKEKAWDDDAQRSKKEQDCLQAVNDRIVRALTEGSDGGEFFTINNNICISSQKTKKSLILE